MAAGGGIYGTWSNLPDDNLADVYHRLSSARDQACFASVCKSWRAVAWWHPAPLVPVLLPWAVDSNRKNNRRTRAHSLESGSAMDVPVPWFARGKRFVGSYNGGWIAAVSNLHQIMIVNLSSGAQVPLSTTQRIVPCTCNDGATPYGPCTGVGKIIFSDSPAASSGCILAAITGRKKLAVCRIGSSSSDNINDGWIVEQGCRRDPDKVLMDIAFCKGDLYGFAQHSLEVYKFQLGVVTTASTICIRSPFVQRFGATYIFELGGKLAMALEANSTMVHQCEACFFMVFELDETPCGYMWTEVTTLGDHALFLSPPYSKAMRLPPVEGRRGGVERNHIYYTTQHSEKLVSHVAWSARIDLGAFYVYHSENHFVHRSGSQSSVRRLEKQAVHLGGEEFIYSSEKQAVLRYHLNKVHGLRQCLETMIPSQGYHCIYNYKDGRNGCIWLFLPRDDL